ncbi:MULTISPECIES: hypothetical protein [unclassified Meridianimarinicoccus]|uniref:hypothetical protein n=1 Tax=unclassified Meridianimarinicoccus TaxID=2923344 RepID=UPI0018683EB2|nr:hypothetical protein [Fluviibacterium sp. MJW13]
MSQADSFIEEVTEEVRRDRLFALARKYGWIPILAVVLIVAGASYVEWQKAREQAAAEALGDSIFSALERDTALSRLTALESIDVEGDAKSLVALLAASEAAQVDAQRAGAFLKSVIDTPEQPQIYRDLAALKLAGLTDYPLMTADRIALLEPLTAPGAPLRLLAQEQIALLQMERGETDLARDLLQQVSDDAGTGFAQRQRIEQILIVLGPADGDS